MGTLGAKALLMIALVALTGCLGEAVSGATVEDAPSRPARPVVVATPDSGVNPYHVAFAVPPGAPDAYDLIGAEVGAVPVTLSQTGTYEERVEADRAFWENVTVGQLYAFRGTRILALSFSTKPAFLDGGLIYGPDLSPRILDHDGHGTGVAGMILRASPEAVVVMVETDSYLCPFVRQADCIMLPSIPESMEWMAAQPWIDITSTSLAVHTHPPLLRAPFGEMGRVVDASRAAHDAGKLTVAGAGNTPGPTLFGAFQGTPWTIAVGGNAPERNASAVDANSLTIDVVADFTVTVPAAQTLDGVHDTGGTSFAAPYVAGVLAEALRLARLEAGHAGGITGERLLVDAGGKRLSQKEFRDGLNASARIPPPTSWQPNPEAPDPLQRLPYTEAPVLMGGPQVGWGFVDETLAPEIAARALDPAALPPQPGKDLAAAYQARQHALREAYWAAWP